MRTLHSTHGVVNFCFERTFSVGLKRFFGVNWQYETQRGENFRKLFPLNFVVFQIKMTKLLLTHLQLAIGYDC